MQDIQGREYAKLSQLKAGDIVTVDGDMDCMKPWSQHIVEVDDFGLSIPCKHGAHYLNGQLRDETDKDDSLIGIYAGEVAQ